MYSVIGNDGQVYGPVDVATLGEWSKEGRLLHDSNLIDALDGRVMRAHEVRDLQPFFFVAPPVVQNGQTVTPGTARPIPTPATPYQNAPQNTPYNGYANGYAAGPQPQQNQYVPVPQQQAASFQQGTPGMPNVQVNNYVAMNNQNAVVYAAGPPRSRTTALLLCFFFGTIGVHRFYLGHKGSGTAMLLMTLFSVGYLSPVTGIWALVDFICLCTNSLKDSDNRLLT